MLPPVSVLVAELQPQRERASRRVYWWCVQVAVRVPIFSAGLVSAE
jgi:hypothetical protein